MATVDEYKKFITNEPESVIEYRTFELNHPNFDQPYRFVNAYKDKTLTLEAGAPSNPSEAVVFTASTLDITEPAERQDGEQLLTVSFGNTAGTIHEILDQVQGNGFFTEASVIYRKYFSSDLSIPVTTPLYLFASGINFDGIESVSFIAQDSNLNSKAVGIIYTTNLFPGLIND